MMRDLQTIDDKELDLSIFLLWASGGLAGGLLDFNKELRKVLPGRAKRWVADRP